MNHMETTLTTPTTVTELFGDLNGRFDDDGLLAAALPEPGLTALGARQVLGRRVTDAVASALDLDLGDLLLDGWTGLRELRAAAARTRETPGEPEEVPLAEHEITSTHHPAVELYVHDALVATLTLELEVTFTLQAVIAEVRDGSLVGVRAGEVEITAKLAAGDHDLGERHATCPVGMIVQLGAGVPLVGATGRTRATPGTGSRGRTGPAGGWWRALLGAVVVLLVLAAGGVATRVLDPSGSTAATAPAPSTAPVPPTTTAPLTTAPATPTP